MSRTTVFGAYDTGTFGAVERVADHVAVPAAGMPRQRLWRIVAKRTVIAQGATERPIVFGNNDRPGVMLASAVRSYINRFGVAPGETAVVFLEQRRCGAARSTISSAPALPLPLLSTRAPHCRPTSNRGRASIGIRVFEGGVVADALGRSARQRALVLSQRTGTSHSVACDLIAVSGGFNPNIQVTTHLGGRPQWQEGLAAFVPGPTAQGNGGRRRGKRHLFLVFLPQRRCAMPAWRLPRQAVSMRGLRPIPVADDELTEISAFWHVEGAKQKAFVDQQNDVTASDIRLAEREGYRSVEHLKRYTTLGMATDQGKTSNVNGLAILAELTGKTIPATGIDVSAAALHASFAWRARRRSSRQAFQADAAHAVSRLGEGARRGLHRSRNVAARAVFSEAGRERLADDGQPGGDVGSKRRRRLRRLNTRQDRSSRHGRG